MQEELLENTEDDAAGSVLVFTVPEGAAGRLDAWLAAQASGLSRARIQTLIKEGRVTFAGGPIKANAPVKAGQVFVIDVPAPLPAVPQPQAIPLDILYEDGDLLVLNKPAGLVVHPAPGHADGTLVNALLHHCRDLGGVGGVERPGIVHRLDKETSGLLVVAKNDAAMAGLVRLFQNGGITKEYEALVHGAPPRESGTVSGLIGRHPVDRKRMAVVRANGRQAITHYTLQRRMGKGVSWVRCRIETGRTHQIRVHMQALGCPGWSVTHCTAGRRPTGACRSRRNGRCCMRRISAFAHPVSGVALDFRAPPPDDFMCVAESLSEISSCTEC